MDITSLATMALLLSGVVNRAVEFCKATLSNTAFYRSLDGEQQVWLIRTLAFLCGVLTALAANFNILSLVPAAANVPVWAGYTATGFALSLGSDGLHVVLDILYASRDHQQAKAFAVETHALNEPPPTPPAG